MKPLNVLVAVQPGPDVSFALQTDRRQVGDILDEPCGDDHNAVVIREHKVVRFDCDRPIYPSDIYRHLISDDLPPSVRVDRLGTPRVQRERILLKQAKVPHVSIHHCTNPSELLRESPGDVPEKRAAIMRISLDDLHTADREVLKHPQTNTVVNIGFSQDLLPSARKRMSEKHGIIRLIQGADMTV